MSLIEMKVKESTSESKVDEALPTSTASGLIELVSVGCAVSVIVMSYCLTHHHISCFVVRRLIE